MEALLLARSILYFYMSYIRYPCIFDSNDIGLCKNRRGNDTGIKTKCVLVERGLVLQVYSLYIVSTECLI